MHIYLFNVFNVNRTLFTYLLFVEVTYFTLNLNYLMTSFACLTKSWPRIVVMKKGRHPLACVRSSVGGVSEKQLMFHTHSSIYKVHLQSNKEFRTHSPPLHYVKWIFFSFLAPGVM